MSKLKKADWISAFRNWQPNQKHLLTRGKVLIIDSFGDKF